MVDIETARWDPWCSFRARRLPVTGPEAFRQLESANRRMASRAQHRPAALTDDPSDADLSMEATRYAAGWLEDEQHDLARVIDYPEHADRTAVVYAIEAARALCAGDHRVARELLDLAFVAAEHTSHTS
jgi:hypothetical protein